jgi:hypothetical protein
MGDQKYALEMAGPLNKVTARLGDGGKKITVVPQQVAYPVKTVWRLPIPLIRRIFGRTQVYRVITQVAVYPPGPNGGIDVDRAEVCMTLRRNKKPFGLKGAMADDWDEVWDAIEIMEKVNPKHIVVQGSRADTPFEK